MRKTKTTKRRAAKRAPVPLSLRYLFTLLQEDDATAIASMGDAERALPMARAIVRGVHNEDDFRIADVLEQAAIKVYPGIEAPIEASCHAVAGFNVGVAAAWLIMQEMREVLEGSVR